MTSAFCSLLLAASVQMTVQDAQTPRRLDRWTAGKAGIRCDTTDRVLRVSGDGWIRTSDEYLDFLLHLRFRVLTKDADGAVLMRAWQREAGGRPSTGYRLAITGPAVKRRAPLVTGLSAKTRIVSGSPETMVPRGDLGAWRELAILCRHDRVTVSVDGLEVGVIEGVEPQAGAVGIEVRKGVIEFDDIWLIEGHKADGRLFPGPRGPLPSATAPVSAGPFDTQPVREVRPRYSPDALAARIEGAVLLELLILADGSVGDVRVIRALNHDLDLEAVAAARRWRFKPPIRAGVSVPVLVMLELAFNLRR